MAKKKKGSASELLREVPLFAGCTAKELSRIARLTTQIALPAGSVLAKEGKPGFECFVIADGKAKVTLRGRKVAVLGPGDIVGEMALLDSGPRSATVVAEDDMKVYVLDPREFATMLDETPWVGRKILKAMAQRLRNAEKAPTH
jgi:CRP/FNR family cyclic AMP-dependent transcriptional regulator